MDRIRLFSRKSVLFIATSLPLCTVLSRSHLAMKHDIFRGSVVIHPLRAQTKLEHLPFAVARRGPTWHVLTRAQTAVPRLQVVGKNNPGRMAGVVACPPEPVNLQPQRHLSHAGTRSAGKRITRLQNTQVKRCKQRRVELIEAIDVGSAFSHMCCNASTRHSEWERDIRRLN